MNLSRYAEMKFSLADGKTQTIKIDHVKEGVTDVEVNALMDWLMKNQVFENQLVEKKEANIIVVNETEVKLTEPAAQ